MSLIRKQLKREYRWLRSRFEQAPTRLPLLVNDEQSERRMLGRLKLRKRTLLDAAP